MRNTLPFEKDKIAFLCCTLHQLDMFSKTWSVWCIIMFKQSLTGFSCSSVIKHASSKMWHCSTSKPVIWEIRIISIFILIIIICNNFVPPCQAKQCVFHFYHPFLLLLELYDLWQIKKNTLLQHFFINFSKSKMVLNKEDSCTNYCTHTYIYIYTYVHAYMYMYNVYIHTYIYV